MHAHTFAPDFIIVDTITTKISAGHVVLTDVRGVLEAVIMVVRLTVEVSIARDTRGNTCGLLRVLREESAAVIVAL